MTDKKKSFLLYLDTLEILHKLTDEQAGKLLKAFLSYHSGEELNLDSTLDLVFFSFQAQFERDGEKYKNIVDRNKNNGSKGGRPKNPAKAKEPNGLFENPSKPKKADSVSVSVKDSDSDNKHICQQVADEWNNVFNGELSLVSKLTQKRKSAVNGCIKEMKGTGHDFTKIETWSGLFNYAKGLDFLMGRTSDWSMSFDFITTKSKLIKIIEGDYDNK